MERIRSFLLVALLCTTVVACQSNQTPPTSAGHPPFPSRGTTSNIKTSVTITTTTAVSQITGQSTTDPTSGYEHITVSQPFKNEASSELFKEVPWTTPPKVAFHVEVPYNRGNLYEVLFTTEQYKFLRSYMAETWFVFDDGTRYTQQKLQELVNSKAITPDDLTAVFDLNINAKEAADVATGESRTGNLISYRRYRKAVVKKNHNTVHIYPPVRFYR